MVDPINITNYNRTDAELEELIIFSICVSGKNAITTAKCLDRLMMHVHKEQPYTPFETFRKYDRDELMVLLPKFGIGCQTMKSRGIHEMVNSGINLRTCTEQELDAIYGINLKTAVMFILHTRPDYRGAVLDVHMLKHLKKLGHKVPKSSPGSVKRYKQIQEIVLNLVDESGMTAADFDLMLWREYSGHIAA